MRYLSRRLLHSLFLVLGVSVLSFVFLELAPGDFFDEMRLNAQISPETVASLRAHYGLDRPLPVRYLRWVKSVLRGEFGFSFAYNTPTAAILWPRARNTLFLTVTGTLLAWLVAIPVGVWSASRQGRWADRACGATTSTLLAVPDLLLALGLLMLAARTRWLPTGGMASLGFSELGIWSQMRDLATHLLLPALALTVVITPILIRHVRAGVIEVLHAPFIRAARAHGIPRRRLLFRHALPAAANPLISLLGLSVASLLSASLLIEVVLSWPGLGPLLLEAILARDLYLVIGAIMLSTTLLIGGNLLADVLLYAADPRIRTE